jgi:hypothetical protein
MIIDPVRHVRRAALVDPDSDFFDSAAEGYDVLVKAIEQGMCRILGNGGHGISSIEKESVVGNKKPARGGSIRRRRQHPCNRWIGKGNNAGQTELTQIMAEP